MALSVQSRVNVNIFVQKNTWLVGPEKKKDLVEIASTKYNHMYAQQ